MSISSICHDFFVRVKLEEIAINAHFMQEANLRQLFAYDDFCQVTHEQFV